MASKGKSKSEISFLSALTLVEWKWTVHRALSILARFTTFLSVNLTWKSYGLSNPSAYIFQSWFGSARLLSNLRSNTAINLFVSHHNDTLAYASSGTRPNYRWGACISKFIWAKLRNWSKIRFCKSACPSRGLRFLVSCRCWHYGHDHRWQPAQGTEKVYEEKRASWYLTVFWIQAKAGGQCILLSTTSKG